MQEEKAGEREHGAAELKANLLSQLPGGAVHTVGFQFCFLFFVSCVVLRVIGPVEYNITSLVP